MAAQTPRMLLANGRATCAPARPGEPPAIQAGRAAMAVVGCHVGH